MVPRQLLVVTKTEDSEAECLAPRPGALAPSHRAGTGSQSTAIPGSGGWGQGASRVLGGERPGCPVYTPGPSFSDCSVKSAVHPSSVCSGGKAEGFSFGVSQVTLDPSRSNKSWQEPLPIPTESLSFSSSGHSRHREAWKTTCTHTPSLHTLPHTPMYSHTLTYLHTLTYSHLHTHTPMYSYTLTYIHAISFLPGLP